MPPTIPEPDLNALIVPLLSFQRLYNAQLRTERKSTGTIRAYDYALDRYARWFRGVEGRDPLLGDFTVANVRLFLADAMDRPKWEGHRFLQRDTDQHISSATLHQYARSLKTFGGWLEREGYVGLNPLYTLRMPKLDQRQLVPLTEEEEQTLLHTYGENNATDCRLKAIFLLMLDTGLRVSEVITLTDEGVDFEHGFIVVMGKGRKERSVPFGFTTEKVLRKYAAFFRPEPASPRVVEFFLTPDGLALTPKAMTMLFSRARQRTGIKRRHPHLLRHTYGIRAQENDMPTLTLQHYMGHSSSKVTERYVHAALSERLKRARGYSPIDQLQIRLNQNTSRQRAAKPSRSGR